MTIVKYIGNRPYVEFKHNDVAYGFSRGMERSDIPDDLVTLFKEPGFPQWEVEGVKTTTATKQMLEAVEETIPEPVEEPVEEVVEEVVGELPDDFETWHRAKMMKWFRYRGDEVANTSTKASLIARFEALQNGSGN